MVQLISRPLKVNLVPLQIFVITMSFFTGCGGQELASNKDSDLAGGWSSITDAFSKSFKKGSHYLSVRPSSEVGKFLGGLKQGLRMTGSRVRSQGPQKAFQLAFFMAAKDGPVIPPDQVFQAIRTTLDDPTGCSGVSCGRVFGISKKTINPVMDDMVRAIRESPTLTQENRRPLREKLLASLRRTDRQFLWDGSKVGLMRDGRNFSSLNGTCVVPALQAFGLRTLGAYPDFLNRLKGGKNSIDYRNNSPKPSQLSTGACHLFATVEMFKHAKNPALSASKTIDIPYTFAEIWSFKLGLNAEDAIAKELKFLDSLESAQLKYIDELAAEEGVSATTKNRELLFKRAIDRFGLQMRFEGHGNSPFGDFRYISTNGAVHAGHSLPPLSMEQIESLGEKIALARLRVVEQTVLRKAPMTASEKRALVEGPIGELFTIADRSRKAPREIVKKEVKLYKLELRPFDVANKPHLEEKFFNDLRVHGPVHIDVNSHSTIVAGYDARKKVFFIRDSDDPLNRPYTEVHQDELFAQLKAYYVMVRKP